jgi:hypothetical protein
MTTQPFAVPAWCNPLPGKFRLNAKDFWLGLLCLDGSTLSYVTADAAKFSAPLAQLEIRWRSGNMLRMPRCDIIAKSTLYRLYFERWADAPEYDRTVAERIGENMATLGVLQNLGGVVGDAFLIVQFLGELISFPAAVVEHRTAVANFNGLRERVGAVGRKR